MKREDYTNEVLLDVLASYARMIQVDKGKYPKVVLSDIDRSIRAVLKTCEYSGKFAKYLKEDA